MAHRGNTIPRILSNPPLLEPGHLMFRQLIDRSGLPFTSFIATPPTNLRIDLLHAIGSLGKFARSDKGTELVANSP